MAYPDHRPDAYRDAYRDDRAYHDAEHRSGLTSYALVKYAFILATVIVVLFFLARYVIPLISGR